eukprot:gene9414-4147_t
MSLLEELKENGAYGDFFADDFDASRLATSIIQGGTIASSLEKLSSGIARLETELHAQVVTRHDDLLLQATGIQKLEDVLKMVSVRVAALSKSFARIHSKVAIPYQAIVTRTNQLSRLQAACEILRRTLRYLYLAKRLQGQLRGGAQEAAKAASTLTELNELTVRIATDLVDSDLAEVQSAMESALDQTTLSDTAASYGSGTSTAAMRAALWTRLETFMDSLLKVAIRMRHLERVLAKKKDPTTHIRFLDDVLPPPDAAEGGGSAVGGAAATTSTSLVMQFWHKLSVTMSATLGKLKDDASFIHQYPRLLKLCRSMTSRIPQQNRLENLGTGVTDQVEMHMLAKAMTPPSVDEVVGICKAVETELHVASGDLRFAMLIARNVAKTIQLYGANSEQMFSNIALANRLDQLCKGVAAILASPAAAALPVDVANLIETARQAAVQLLGAIIEPTFGAIAKLLEQCIRQIHYEDYSLHTAGEDAEGGGGGTVSGFISDLQRNSNHVQTELISRFTCKDAVAPRIKAGRLKLAGDMAEFELAFAPFDCRLSELGVAYRQLRALRPLLFLDVEGIVASPAVGESISVSLVAHHLFSHAPEDILPPHNLKGWTFEQSEVEILSAIRESLEVYANTVKERGGKEFHPIYPTMLNLCKRI